MKKIMDINNRQKFFIIKPIKIIFKKITTISLESIREFFFFDLYKYIKKPKKYVRNILRSFKFIKKIIIQNQKSQMFFKKYNLKFNNDCQINPKKIQYWLEGNFNEIQNYSRLLKRDWEKRKNNIESSIIYRSFESRFKEDKKWEETEFYHQVLNQISLGIFKWDCNDKKQLDKWLKVVDLLYFQIESTIETTKNMNPTFDEIFEKFEQKSELYKVSAVIDKEGHILIYNGIWIILIAGILDIPEVTVQIMARHNEWKKFKKNLMYITKGRNKKLYQYLLHPDLQDIPHRHGAFRYELLKENLSILQGTVLDIGSNYGYFCHKFEDDGFNCYAVEYNPYNLYFLKKLKLSENKRFNVIPASIFEFKKNQKLMFDVALALNVFHHFLKKKDLYFNLIKLLKRLEVKELFFRAHHPRTFRNIKVYRNYNPDQFVNFILENSCLNSAELIEERKYGRSLFKLTSN